MAPPRLSMHGIALRYGSTSVLDGVEFAVAAGEVHALLGENGAGKSSLLKAVAGAVPLHAGRIEIDGVPFAPRDPLHAARWGIAMIHQELSVLAHLSVADNVLLGRERHRFGWLDRRARDRAAAAALALLGHADLPMHARTGDLSPASRQIVEIARALAQDARVLVMDEPTSSLGGDDVARLLAAIETLRARGLAIVYVSHVLAEVRAVATRATVLRDGRSVFSGELAAIDDAALVRHMAGREVRSAGPRAAAAPAGGATVLAVEDLAGAPLPRRVSFALHRGEVLGIGGLCGSGRSELLEVLGGVRAATGGRVDFVGRDIALGGGGAGARWRHGIGSVAEDRKLVGLSLARPIGENVVLPRAGRWSQRGWLRPTTIAAVAAAACERLRVRCSGPGQRVGDLSGGNQQKVAFARLLANDADVLLLDEPTRGIDVGSRQEIHALLRERAAHGSAVLVVSSQLPELLELCDRVAVMRDGVLGAARPVADWTQETLLQSALGHEGAA